MKTSNVIDQRNFKRQDYKQITLREVQYAFSYTTWVGSVLQLLLGVCKVMHNTEQEC
jgi:hypothetical protein